MVQFNFFRLIELLYSSVSGLLAAEVTLYLQHYRV